MSSLLAKLRAKAAAKPVKSSDATSSATVKLLAAMGRTHSDPRSRAGKAHKAAGVSHTGELDRILALPRRLLDVAAGTIDGRPILDVTPLYARPGGTMRLWPVQSAALIEASEMGGELSPIGVGHGKTLIDLLLPDAVGAVRAVLLTKAQLRDQLFASDIPLYEKHFYLPLDRLTVVSYEDLSSARKADVLTKLKPDLIIADEGHALRHRSSARTKRFLRYLRDNPACKFVCLSGTVTTRSIKDYAHLAELALKKFSPLPYGYRELEDWAAAIDVPLGDGEPMPPGALELLCAPGEHVRSGYRRRLVETPGVIATEEGALGTSLVIRALRPAVPDAIRKALKTLRKTWSWDGEEYEDGMSLARVARQLALGFYYRWDWPGGEPDTEWLDARRDWHREVRSYLAHAARPGMDSPLLLSRAAAKGAWRTPFWEPWDAVRKRYRPHPPVAAVWVSDGIMDAVDAWMRDRVADPGDGMGIVWYEHDAVGARLRQLGWSVFGGGESAEALATCREPAIACSIKAHGTGKNLQQYSCALVVSPPANGAAWEQLLGREHRPGQLADEVVFDVLLHTKELENAIDRSLEDARYIEQTQGQRQKLLYATKIIGGGGI
jgi:hypothetical protein